MIFIEFWKPEDCSQTVLPDRSILLGQKFVEKCPKKINKCDILSDFQTMCNMSYDVSMNSSSFQLIGHASFVAKCSLQKVTDRSNFYSIYNAVQCWGLLALKHPSRLRKKL